MKVNSGGIPLPPHSPVFPGKERQKWASSQPEICFHQSLESIKFGNLGRQETAAFDRTHTWEHNLLLQNRVKKGWKKAAGIVILFLQGQFILLAIARLPVLPEKQQLSVTYVCDSSTPGSHGGLGSLLAQSEHLLQGPCWLNRNRSVAARRGTVKVKATQCREANTNCREEKSVHAILKHSDFPTRDVLIQKWKLFDTPFSLNHLLGTNDLNPHETDFIFIKKNRCAFFTVLQQTGCTSHWEPTEINVTGTGVPKSQGVGVQTQTRAILSFLTILSFPRAAQLSEDVTTPHLFSCCSYLLTIRPTLSLISLNKSVHMANIPCALHCTRKLWCPSALVASSQINPYCSVFLTNN